MKNSKNILLVSALLLTAAVFFLRVTQAEPRMLMVRDHTIRLERLPKEHDGLRIALAADLHYRPGQSESLLKEVGSILRKRQPDIVLLAGDFIDRRTPDSLPNVDNLAQFVTDWHGRYGTFAVSGNHDIYLKKQSWEKITSMLKRAGVTVLNGRGAAVPIHGKNFQLFGTGDEPDAWFRIGCLPPDFDLTMPVYGLIHNPEYFYSIYNRFDLIFSAHTHHGQVRVPVWGEEIVRPILRRGWRGCGLRTRAGRMQFTTSGIGMSTCPVRWHDLPEVVFITLKRVKPAP